MPDEGCSGGIVHVVAPFGRDADAIAAVLGGAGLSTRVAASLGELTEALDDQAGLVLFTEEAMGSGKEALVNWLFGQPSWSDLPLLALRSPRANRRSPFEDLTPRTMNMVELDRPLGRVALLSSVQGALRARQKQFLVRDQMRALAEGRAALERSESELRLIADAMPVLIAFIGRDLHYRFANKAYEHWFEMPVGDVIGRHISEVVGREVWEARQPVIEQVLAGESRIFEISWPARDGRRRDCEVRYTPRFAAGGEVDGFHVFVTDITVSKLALEASREHALELENVVAERTRELEAQMAAREASEAALRQSQKMEAIGQLTGGIAHDFNNMLTGILSALDIVRMRVEMGRVDDLERFLDIATDSSQRAAGLTQRLLAFSRRQSLDARAVEINTLMASVQHLLRSTLGESVRIRIDASKTPLHARLDANQFESALLNLAINARDAMPGGGDLVLSARAMRLADGERATVPAGHYAEVAVSDTGAGMPAEVVERAFEPFFTTKPIGKGTGLGMSMVYGFMQQSGGHITIDSAPGQGTTISLFIPLIDACEDEDAVEAPVPLALGAGQSILVVEDDPQVRALVTVVLEELGYQVEVVGNADGAIPVLASARPIDLLVTDVGLPGLNGRQLAEIARQSRPALPVLFMTGYAEKAQDRAAFLEPGMSMIAKPFLLDAFSDAIRASLAETR